MKIIDSNDNAFICRVGSPLTGIKLKKVYVWDEELVGFDWESYAIELSLKFIDKVAIKINKRFNLDRVS